MRGVILRAAGVAAILAGLGPAAGAEAMFRGLGDLPGGRFESVSTGVSADGSVVVGYSHSAASSGSPFNFEAFRWTATTGMVGLGDLPGGNFSSFANGVSADGSVVVGRAGLAGPQEAFRWTAATGLVGLGDLPGGGSFSQADDVSADGSVVVGLSVSAAGFEAFRWDATFGMLSVRDLLIAQGLDLTGWRLTEALVLLR